MVKRLNKNTTIRPFGDQVVHNKDTKIMDKTAEERTEAIARKFIAIEEWDIGEDLRQIITNHLNEYSQQVNREKEKKAYYAGAKNVDTMFGGVTKTFDEWIKLQQ